MKTSMLTRTMGYIMTGSMLIAGMLISALYFDKLSWQTNRWFLYMTILLMTYVIIKMHNARKKPRRFFILTTLLVMLGVLEIGSWITLTVFTLNITGDMEMSLINRIINTVSVFLIIIYNMIIGVWLADRVSEIKQSYMTKPEW